MNLTKHLLEAYDNSMDKLNESFNREEIIKGFEEFIKREYNINNVQDLADQLEHVSENDVNRYFSDLFYDLEDDEDLDVLNQAEDFIRREYCVIEPDDDEQVNESESPKEEVSFDEIEARMANAGDYDDLYAAVSLIQDPSIRVAAENMLDICKADGDDVETAYSVTTTEYVDPYRNDENIFIESEETNQNNDFEKLVNDIYDFYKEWDPYSLDYDKEIDLDSIRKALSDPDDDANVLYDLQQISNELNDDPKLKAKADSIIGRLMMESEKLDEKKNIPVKESEMDVDKEYIVVSDSDPQNENEYFDNEEEAIKYCKEQDLDRVVLVDYVNNEEEEIFTNDK